MTNRLQHAAAQRRQASDRFRQLVKGGTQKPSAPIEPEPHKTKPAPKPFAAAAAPARQPKVVAATA